MINKENETMTGTEKQIAWANDIVAGWIGGIKKEIKGAQDRVANGSMPAIWAEIWERVGSSMIEKMGQFPEASMVIRDKDRGLVAAITAMCKKEYTEKTK